MRSFDLNTGRITAALGPTNTGKTHRALQRMLAHPSGMIGLPLRLLAQEVYERLEKDRPGQVALVTGEQKRIPPNPRYWVCTVEAMPMDVPVHFLAIDEIQLAGQQSRGHVFTQRLMHARGHSETWLMGSDSIAPLLEQLVPTAEMQWAKRLSTLKYTGPRKLLSLPKRSAIVAFSVAEVYEIAERLRRKHGGAAVVLGALSPRARNAQVALYQSGQVDYIVATDAIGMGLNLRVRHVALAATRKFDGRRMRELTVGELAQIAGRAGRYKSDGTFGTLSSVGPLHPDTVHAIQSHRFPALKKLYWRNHDLDMSSLSALLESLAKPSPMRFLQQVRDWPDSLALAALAQQPGVLARVQAPQSVELTWQVAQIPDFRKTLTGAHVQLLTQLLRMLLEQGAIPAQLLAQRLEHLDRMDGDIDTLMTRVAWVRTWNYVSHRRGWLVDPASWQARCQDLEERLSQALHQALARRFLANRSVVMTETASLETQSGTQSASKHPSAPMPHEISGSLRGLRYSPVPGRHTRALTPELEGQLREELERRVHTLVSGPDSKIELDTQAQLSWGGALVASLVGGSSMLTPQVNLVRNGHLSPQASALLLTHLQGWLLRRVYEALGPLAKVPGRLRSEGRELMDTLQQNLGAVPAEQVQHLVSGLSPIDRQLLAKSGVRLGTEHVFSLYLEQDVGRYARALLYALYRRRLPLAQLPKSRTTVEDKQRDPGLYQALGFVLRGALAIRVDTLERLAAEARMRSRQGPFHIDPQMQRGMGVPAHKLRSALLEMGYESEGEALIAE